MTEEHDNLIKSIKDTTDPASDNEFKFKSNSDMKALVNDYAISLSGMIKDGDPKDIKCKGIRIYFVDSKSNTLMSAGLFVNGFDPEEWVDK